MRSRIVKEEFWTDEDLGNCSTGACFTFIGLWCIADRDGRLLDSPAFIRTQVYPYQNPKAVETVQKHLGELQKIGAIIPYEVDGKKCLLIPNFKKHQKIHPNEKKSILPEPPLNLTTPSDMSDNVITCNDIEDQCNRMSRTSTSTLTSTSDCTSVSEMGHEPTQAPYPPDFEEFWTAYPKKRAKGSALKAWKASKKNGHPPQELILEAVDIQSKSQDWTKDGGKFIPHPATWINGKRWDDDVEDKYQPPTEEEAPF